MPQELTLSKDTAKFLAAGIAAIRRASSRAESFAVSEVCGLFHVEPRHDLLTLNLAKGLSYREAGDVAPPGDFMTAVLTYDRRKSFTHTPLDYVFDLGATARIYLGPNSSDQRLSDIALFCGSLREAGVTDVWTLEEAYQTQLDKWGSSFESPISLVSVMAFYAMQKVLRDETLNAYSSLRQFQSKLERAGQVNAFAESLTLAAYFFGFSTFAEMVYAGPVQAVTYTPSVQDTDQQKFRLAPTTVRDTGLQESKSGSEKKGELLVEIDGKVYYVPLDGARSLSDDDFLKGKHRSLSTAIKNGELPSLLLTVFPEAGTHTMEETVRAVAERFFNLAKSDLQKTFQMVGKAVATYNYEAHNVNDLAVPVEMTSSNSSSGISNTDQTELFSNE